MPSQKRRSSKGDDKFYLLSRSLKWESEENIKEKNSLLFSTYSTLQSESSRILQNEFNKKGTADKCVSMHTPTIDEKTAKQMFRDYIIQKTHSLPAVHARPLKRKRDDASTTNLLSPRLRASISSQNSQNDEITADEVQSECNSTILRGCKANGKDKNTFSANKSKTSESSSRNSSQKSLHNEHTAEEVLLEYIRQGPTEHKVKTESSSVAFLTNKETNYESGVQNSSQKSQNYEKTAQEIWLEYITRKSRLMNAADASAKSFINQVTSPHSSQKSESDEKPAHEKFINCNVKDGSSNAFQLQGDTSPKSVAPCSLQEIEPPNDENPTKEILREYIKQKTRGTNPSNDVIAKIGHVWSNKSPRSPYAYQNIGDDALIMSNQILNFHADNVFKVHQRKIKSWSSENLLTPQSSPKAYPTIELQTQQDEEKSWSLQNSQSPVAFEDFQTQNFQTQIQRDERGSVNGMQKIKIESEEQRAEIHFRRCKGCRQLIEDCEYRKHRVRSVCNSCGKVFECKALMVNIALSKDTTEEICHFCFNPNNGYHVFDPNKCHICHKSVKPEDKMKHFKSCICHVCDKIFRCQGFIKTQVNTPSGKTGEICCFCDDRINRSGEFTSFVDSVSEKYKPYVCKICRTRYKKKYTMDIHMRIHMGDKPYACQSCPKRFHTRGNQIQHLITHLPRK